MAKAKPSEEYTAFDTLMGNLLTVSKADLNKKMAAHRETVDKNPERRGPRRKGESPRQKFVPRKGRTGPRRAMRPSAEPSESVSPDAVD